MASPEHAPTIARALVATMIVALAAACAPAPPPASGVDQAGVAPRAVKSITIAMDHEPDVIVTALGVRTPTDLRNALQQHLSTYNERSQILPQLAVELPSQANGSWIVRPDGTMVTTYHLRPNVLWHDGAPLRAADFAFAWTVVMDPGLPIESRDEAREIARIDTPDDSTLAIEWARPYAYAHAIVNDDLGPFPAHLLRSSYDAGDKGQFWNLPYWTHEFVGVGPYRIADWVHGSHIQLEAFDKYYAGRVKIDRITMRFMPDVDTIVANLLAGAVDLPPGGFVKYDQLVGVERRWEQDGKKGTLILQTGEWRLIWFQQRPDLLVFPELKDVRVRQGMLLALDRQAIVEALTEGNGQVSDTFIPPDDVRWDWVRDGVVRYPYDPSRAEQLFADAGLRRGSEGVFRNTAGMRMVLPEWVNAATQNEQEAAIAADQWKRFGVPTEQMVLSRTQINDLKYKATFPALYHTSVPRLVEIPGTRFGSVNCPNEQNNWLGFNYGCYSSPEADQILQGLRAAIDVDQQKDLYRGLVKLHTEQLPMLPLYFGVAGTLARRGITGITGSARPYGGGTWNLAAWDIQ